MEFKLLVVDRGAPAPRERSRFMRRSLARGQIHCVCPHKPDSAELRLRFDEQRTDSEASASDMPSPHNCARRAKDCHALGFMTIARLGRAETSKRLKPNESPRIPQHCGTHMGT